jgi:hypothetical protein
MVPNQPPIATNTLQNNGVLKLEHFCSVDINTLDLLRNYEGKSLQDGQSYSFSRGTCH